MTAQLIAPENLKALYTDAAYEPTLAEWNWLVHEGGAAYKSELSARTVFESELFGMNTYILMSMMEDYLRVPERLRAIRRHATPTELVERALPIGNKRSFINLAAMPLHYLTGRELFVDLGENTLADGLDDQLEVLRFWREATIAMRTDGVLYNMHADPVNSSHVVGDELMARIRGHLVPADDEVKTAIRKFGARLTAYAFLENCDARTAVCDTGPYELEDGTFLALRETCADGDGDFPWLDGIRETLPYHHFVLAYRLPRTSRWTTTCGGTAWFTPSDYQADIIETRVFCTDDGVLTPLGSRRSTRPPRRSARPTAPSTSAWPRPIRRSATSTPRRCTRGRPRRGPGSPAATTRSTGRSPLGSRSRTSGSPTRTWPCN